MGERMDAAVLLGVMNTLNDHHHDLRARIRLCLDGLNEDGGPGSGNWGHSGRPGMRGGSMPGGGVKNRISMKDGSYSSAAKQRKKADPEQEKYRKVREDARKLREAWKEAQDRTNELSDRIFGGGGYNSGPGGSWFKEMNQWAEKEKERKREYFSSVKALGIDTRTEADLCGSDIEWNPVGKQKAPLGEEEIIKALGGGDRTEGSCASLALAYAGQKQGYNVLDFRDGESRSFFSDKGTSLQAFRDFGADPIVEKTEWTGIENGRNLLNRLEDGKQYCFVSCQHAAIVRVFNGKPQYLELQSQSENGWKNFGSDPVRTLRNRFGGNEDSAVREAFAVDINQLKGETFERVLGYLNTNEGDQQKGEGGYAR